MNNIKTDTTSLNKKVHVCDVCKKVFTYKSKLKIHKLIHSGTKDFQCDTCRKKFARKSDLIRHMLVHTGEKDFQCHICLKKFAISISITQFLDFYVFFSVELFYQ